MTEPLFFLRSCSMEAGFHEVQKPSNALPYCRTTVLTISRRCSLLSVTRTLPALSYSAGKTILQTYTQNSHVHIHAHLALSTQPLSTWPERQPAMQTPRTPAEARTSTPVHSDLALSLSLSLSLSFSERKLRCNKQPEAKEQNARGQKGRRAVRGRQKKGLY